MKRITIVAIALVGVMAFGCVTPRDVESARSQTHKVVTLTAETYDTLMKALGTFYKAGIIGNAERDIAVGYADTFRGAALKIAEGVDDAEFEQNLQIMKDAIEKLKALLERVGVSDAGDVIGPMEQQLALAVAEGGSR